MIKPRACQKQNYKQQRKLQSGASDVDIFRKISCKSRIMSGFPHRIWIYMCN